MHRQWFLVFFFSFNNFIILKISWIIQHVNDVGETEQWVRICLAEQYIVLVESGWSFPADSPGEEEGEPLPKSSVVALLEKSVSLHCSVGMDKAVVGL